MSFSKAADGWIAGHRADGGESVGYEGCFRAHARGCGCGFAASVAAANHCNVESVHHQDLGCRVLAKARGVVKIIGFIENVSRETLRTHPGGAEQSAFATVCYTPMGNVRALRP